MKIAGRAVLMFRCHYDVMIGPKSMKAYYLPGNECRTFNTKAWINEEETGVYVELTRNSKDEQHFIPMTNIEAIQFEPLTNTPEESKRGPGRPKAQAI